MILNQFSLAVSILFILNYAPALACSGTLIHNGGSVSSESCWAANANVNDYEVWLSEDTIAYIISDFESELPREDDPAFQSMNRMMSMLSSEDPGGQLTLSYPADNQNCDYVLSSGRRARILPSEFCADIKFTIAWRIALMMEAERVAALDSDDNNMSFFRQSVLVSNIDYVSGRPDKNELLTQAVSGNILPQDSEILSNSAFFENVYIPQEALNIPILANSNGYVRNDLVWAGDFFNLAKHPDDSTYSFYETSDIREWRLESSNDAWSIFQAALVSKISHNTSISKTLIERTLQSGSLKQIQSDNPRLKGWAYSHG